MKLTAVLSVVLTVVAVSPCLAGVNNAFNPLLTPGERSTSSTKDDRAALKAEIIAELRKQGVLNANQGSNGAQNTEEDEENFADVFVVGVVGDILTLRKPKNRPLRVRLSEPFWHGGEEYIAYRATGGNFKIVKRANPRLVIFWGGVGAPTSESKDSTNPRRRRDR